MFSRGDRLIIAILNDDEAETMRLLATSDAYRITNCATEPSFPLHLSACSNSTRVARLLIDNGESVNRRNGVGDTPLHVAARYNAWETADLLIDRGARMNVRNHAAQTPHDIAVANGNYNVADLLKVANRSTRR